MRFRIFLKKIQQCCVDFWGFFKQKLLRFEGPLNKKQILYHLKNVLEIFLNLRLKRSNIVLIKVYLRLFILSPVRRTIDRKKTHSLELIWVNLIYTTNKKQIYCRSMSFLKKKNFSGLNGHWYITYIWINVRIFKLQNVIDGRTKL